MVLKESWASIASTRRQQGQVEHGLVALRATPFFSSRIFRDGVSNVVEDVLDSCFGRYVNRVGRRIATLIEALLVISVQAIADTGHRHQQTRTPWIRFNFPSELANVHVQAVRILALPNAPHLR